MLPGGRNVPKLWFGKPERKRSLPRSRHQEQDLNGPELDCGISILVAKKAVRDWTNRNHKKHWESITGLKQAKALIPGPSA
jgi:hypothetical protein